MTSSRIAAEKMRRLTEQNRTQEEQLRRAARISPVNFNRNRFGPLVFLMAFGVAGLYFITFSSASPAADTVRAVSLTVEPESRQVGNGELLTLRVWADSLDKPMAAVEAQLSYPTDRFEYVGFDAGASRFTVDNASRGEAGLVVLSRSYTPTPDMAGLTGRQFIGKVVLRAKGAAGAASVGFTESSRILQAGSNTDILERTSGGEYRVSGRL